MQTHMVNVMFCKPLEYVLLMALAFSSFSGCATEPVVTRVVYIDRSSWIRLETNPYAEEASSQTQTAEPAAPSSGVLAALLEGFHAQKDSSPGPGSWILGKPGYDTAFVQPEILLLSSQLAKGFTMASPKEWVAYCLTADFSPNERLITTGWAYVRPPYLYFKLNEYRTAVRVPSPGTSTAEACRTKPLPGTRVQDRFFKLDYDPKSMVVTHGIFGGTRFKSRGEIFNGRGEVVFKLDALPTVKPSNHVSGAKTEESSASNSGSGSKSGTTANMPPSSPPAENSSERSLSPSAVEKLNRMHSSSPPQPTGSGAPKSQPASATTARPQTSGFGPEPRVP